LKRLVVVIVLALLGCADTHPDPLKDGTSWFAMRYCRDRSVSVHCNVARE
jgi:hypothetical protein